MYGTAVRSARSPSLFVDVPEQFSAQGAREVRTPLAPVEAGAAQRSSRARERCDVNPEAAEESAAGIREHEATVRRVFVPVRFDDEQGARLEASEETHGQAAREMVVADACCSKLDVAWTGLHALPAAGSDSHQLLEQFGDLRTGEPEIAMPALALHRQEPGILQLAQVAAGGGRQNAGLERELGRGQRGSRREGRQHAGARRIADERGDP